MSHYKLINNLIAEIKRLRQENNSLGESLYYFEEAASSMERKNRQLRDEVQQKEYDYERERQDQQYREYQREQAMKKLERAESWGDQWGIDRAKRDLKNLI